MTLFFTRVYMHDLWVSIKIDSGDSDGGGGGNGDGC